MAYLPSNFSIKGTVNIYKGNPLSPSIINSQQDIHMLFDEEAGAY